MPLDNEDDETLTPAEEIALQAAKTLPTHELLGFMETLRKAICMAQRGRAVLYYEVPGAGMGKKEFLPVPVVKETDKFYYVARKPTWGSDFYEGKTSRIPKVGIEGSKFGWSTSDGDHWYSEEAVNYHLERQKEHDAESEERAKWQEQPNADFVLLDLTNGFEPKHVWYAAQKAYQRMYGHIEPGREATYNEELAREIYRALVR